MSVRNSSILCKHLVNYKLKHDLEGYNSIQDMLRCSPFGRTVIDNRNSKSRLAKCCSLCSGHHGRLFMCLICSSVTCSTSPGSKGHTLMHSESSSGHEIAVDMDRAELYCCFCYDQVYDLEFDRVVVCKGLSGGDPRLLGNRKRLDLGGSTCFMNFVLQALGYIEGIQSNFEMGDITFLQ